MYISLSDFLQLVMVGIVRNGGWSMKDYKFRKTFSFDGKRYVIRANTEQELYEKIALKKRDLEEGRVVISNSMTVAQWTEKAFATYKTNMSDNVKKDTMLRVNKHILSVIGNLKLKQVKPLHCQEIMNKQVGMSWSHIQKVYQELNFIFDTAVKNKFILDNPASEVVRPKAKKGHRQALDIKEREIFEKVTADNDRFLIFLLMYHCSCRPGEAIACQGTDLTIIDGFPALHIRGTKTEKADRVVPVPLELYRKIKDTSPFSPLAPNDAGRFHTESSYNRAVSLLKREMNIAMGCHLYRNALVPPFPLRVDFVPYDLRHTYCTRLAEMGVDIRVAQRLMGHANISITADIYTHVQDTQLMTEGMKIFSNSNQNKSDKIL